MARPKIPRKSTSVDMTAMCDVAFLLLSFFILTTKFKPSEAVPVNTPSSVAAKVAPETNVVMVSLNKDGKIFISTGDSKNDKDKKAEIIRSVNSHKNLGLSDAEIAALVRAPFIGTPLAQLKQQARLAPEQMTGESLPGIYAKDSTNNELLEWMRGVADAYAGMKPNLLLKGDNVSKYPSFRNVIDAFRKNEFFKFQMVTNPESVPMGTDLFRSGRREE
jgi:biopolymer transport protein ExbD